MYENVDILKRITKKVYLHHVFDLFIRRFLYLAIFQKQIYVPLIQGMLYDKQLTEKKDVTY